MLALIIIIAIAAVTAVIFMHEAKRAIEVDPKEPFLHDDYDPKKDKSWEK
jgi:uncharacterized protein YxeA